MTDRAIPLLICVLLAASGARAVDFDSEIRPIFERSCYGCHGEKQQMGQLRLDGKAAALRGGVSGPAVVSREADKSELYRRVAGIGTQARMPMGGELPAEEIAKIKTWIAEGALWPEGGGEKAEVKTHWAFVKPQKAALPQVRNTSWSANEIDRFILARLEQEGLKPSPPAEKAKLLRRLSLDLIGLPPTIKETNAFLADSSPDAYSKQVERLLDSPHYGERWGRHWLDAARYADSDGFEKDKPRRVWFYRDWVVNALNQDMGYDQFVIEQIAGDLLPHPTQSQLVATGFLRNSMINEEGGIDPEQFRMEAMFDRMDAVGAGVLGLTIKCAQCHNHKYDPLSQADYYRMFAFLNGSHEANVAVYSPEEQMRRAEIFSEIRAIEDELQHHQPDWAARMATWEAEVRDNQPEWIVAAEPKVLGESGQMVYVLEDHSLLAAGYQPTRHTVSIALRSDVKDIRAIRLELMTDPSLPLGGPGRSIFGTAALTEFEVYTAPLDDLENKKKRKRLQIAGASADVNPPLQELDLFYFPDKENKRRVTGEIDFAIDGFEMSAWTTDNGPGRRNQSRKAVFRLAEPLTPAVGEALVVDLDQRHGGYNSDDNQNYNLGRYRLSLTTAEDATADPLPERVRRLLAIPSARRTPEQQRTVFSYWRTTVAEWAGQNERIEKLWASHPDGSAQLVMLERDEPRETFTLARGDYLQKQEQVQPGVPKFLNELKDSDEPKRLQFARWLVDRDAPTTARAAVNRIWQSYFGIGLVETSEDLGMQAPPSSHPQLLDWLAVDLMEHGWSQKHLHRLIANSNAYKQSSRVTPELLERDPDNRLLTRGPRGRVEAEVVRDIALAAAGLLNEEIGGPPVYPPAPKFLFEPPVSYGPKRWYVEEGPERYRRSIYTFRYRSAPYPVLDAFDAPKGDVSCVRRTRSNTPLQALATLNETVFMEAAAALAQKTLAEGGSTDAERISYAFRRCLTREPVAAESSELLALLGRQRARFASGELDPKGLVGEPSPEAAAWTAVSRVLLNLDETITKE